MMSSVLMVSLSIRLPGSAPGQAVSAEAGYNSVRTLQRRMVEVLGMTPVEFRIMTEK